MWSLETIRQMNGMESEDTELTANDKRNYYIDQLRVECMLAGLNPWRFDSYDPIVQRKVRIRAAQRYKGLNRN